MVNRSRLAKLAVKRTSITLGVEEEQIREPTPEIVVSPIEKTKKEKKKPAKPKKKLSKTKSLETKTENTVQNYSTQDPEGDIDDTDTDIVHRSKSFTKKSKVKRSSSYMFSGFRNRSKTSDQKARELSRLPNITSNWKGISYKDKSSSIDRLKVRLSKSRSSSLKRMQSKRSSTCSIDTDSQMSASLTNISGPREVSSLDRRATVSVNPPYHDPLFDSTNAELADALGRPPPPPPKYFQGAPNTSLKQATKKSSLSRKTSSKSHTSETSVEVESAYAEFGDVSDLPHQMTPNMKRNPTKKSSLSCKTSSKSHTSETSVEVESAYAEFGDVSDLPHRMTPNMNKPTKLSLRSPEDAESPKVEPNKRPNLGKAKQFESFDTSELDSTVDAVVIPRSSTGILLPKASSPIKRRGAQVRRQSRQKSFDIAIESEYSCLGEIPRPSSLELDKGVTDEDIKEGAANYHKTGTTKVDTPRPGSSPRILASSRPVASPRPTPVVEEPVGSIYCESGDVFLASAATPTADSEEIEEKIDISKYRKNSQSSAYDLSETDDSSNDTEEPVYAVVIKPRITSKSLEPTSEDLKFVEVKSGFGFGGSVEEETEHDGALDVGTWEDKVGTSEGDMYCPTSDSSSGCPAKSPRPTKRRLEGEKVEGRNCVTSSDFICVLNCHLLTLRNVDNHLFDPKVNHCAPFLLYFNHW